MKKPVKGLFRGKEYNLTEISLKLGMNKSYLSVIADNRERWIFLQTLGEDPFSAVLQYRRLQSELCDKMAEVHRELIETKEMSLLSFAAYLYEKGLYKHRKSFSAAIRQIAMVPLKMMSMSTYDKYSVVLMHFEEYRRKVLHEKRQPLIIVDDLEGKVLER